MKKNLVRKIWLSFFVILFFNNAYSQNKTFKYDFEYKPNSSKTSTIVEKTVLDIKDGSLSAFRTESEKKSDSLIAFTGYGSGDKINFEGQFYIIKNLSEKSILKSIKTLFREVFYIKITENFDWKILPDKNKIFNFDVQKAILNYGGRNWTAWFTTEIPIQDGPYVFHGLPGLIVKISDDKNDYSILLTEIQNANGEIYYRTKGTELTWEQFIKMAENHYSDPLARIKSTNIPFKKDDGHGGMVSVNMKQESDRMKTRIKENNNPIELNHRIEYK
ncbi:GLPGLI family protein [Chryseobacterium sp. Ch-15]|uniref:GLPGLI family protein n=1 Tax=Chryseobacterium muglaense TaxID=2893752 RepID=A0A9Q3YQV9_9FLAO|nr:GLPGLI family protein [Chryseobacterium muglaense]MBD3905071.1 GLPGLI family protein [Chryseobacterium muglaense]MCC9033488.1 GLPGLI family protein [Chryseobacterium muglaense]MCM2555007.1 GLPGLI family protein [Chryseobacterium muglaense]